MKSKLLQGKFSSTASIFAITFLILLNISAQAANRYSVATGNWASTSTWSASSGGSSGASAPIAGDVVYIEGGFAVTVAANAACATLNIASGSSLVVGGFNITVSGATTVGGTLTINNTSGTKTFTGDVIISNGGLWNETAAEAVSFGGNLQNDGTMTCSTGTHTLSGSSKSISGTNPISIANLTVSGTCTNNNASLTVGSSLAGSGTLTNGAAGVLNIGSAISITTLTATAAGNTVKYTGAAQTAKVTTYHHLTLSGSGTKTFSSTPTVNGVLSMEGTATVTVSSGVVTYGSSATLKYNTTTARTASAEEWLGTFDASGGVIIAGTGTISAGAAKIFSATAPLTIESGASLAMGSNLLTLNNNLINNGGTITGSSGVTIRGTGTQSIGSFSVTGTVTMSKTGGVATLTGNISGNIFTMNGNGGTLNLGTGLTHTFTGVWNRNNGTLVGGSSILKIGGSVSGTTGTFTAGNSTVEWNGTGAQTCAVLTYNNLTLSGSNVKTFSTTPTVTGILSMEGTATVTVNTGTVTFGANATLQYKGSAAQTSTNEEFPATFSGTGGVIINNSSGVILNANKTITSLLTFTSGRITTDAYVLSLGANAVVTGAGMGNYVYGSLLWNIPTGSPSRTFYIGDAANYTPVLVDFHTVSTAGTLTATTASGDHPDAGYSEVDPFKSVNRTWTLTSGGGLALANYDATLNFVPGDVDLGANTADFVVRKFLSSAWLAPTDVSDPNPTNIKAVGYTTFGAFQVGELATLLFKMFTTTGAGTFTVPSGVTTVVAECWGGGGAGGGATSKPSAGGGGAGGAYAKKSLTVTPLSTINLQVAASKTGTTAAGGNGNPSWFGSTTTVFAPGGAGGALGSSSGGAGGIGATTGYYGDIAYKGGNGATGISTSGTPGGAGGGGAGSTGIGGNATTGTGGTGASLYGGNGANGVPNSTAGAAGSPYGGGGSGGKKNNNTSRAGGTGAQGLVVVSWSRVTPDLGITKTADNMTPTNGGTVTFTLTATNYGPGLASAVNAYDLLNNGYLYLSHSAGNGSTYNPQTGAWAIGTINNGASVVLTITAQVICFGNYVNTATISGSQADPQPNNNTATITLVPTGGTCPVIAEDDFATTLQATPIVIDVLTNDQGNIVPGSTIVINDPQNGTLQNNNGVFTYTPTGSFTGTDQFTYRIFDNSSPTPQQDDAVVTITVDPDYDDPCFEAVRGHIYYMPFPENETQLGLALYNASNSTGQGDLTDFIRNVTSIKSPYPNVRIIYDHWEDGYEADITVPTQSSTHVWGDGKLSNGFAPGFPNDIIPAGGGIILDNTFKYKPRNSSDIYFDGKDKMFTTQDVAVSKVTGDDTWFALQAAKTDVYDINRFGKSFTIGLGEDITVPTGVTAFKYACLFVRASQDGTTVSLDYDGSGSIDATQNLDEGEVWFWEGTQGTTNATVDLKIGATVTSNKPVGVDILFGGKDNWGTRNFNILPGNFYGNTYYTPVPQVNTNYPAAVYFYNGSNSAINIDWSNGLPASGTITVNAHSFNYLSLANSYGYKFQSQMVSGSRPSYVASEVLCVPNGGTGADFDWAFPLIPEERLTNFTSIAWAPGSKDFTRNDDPLWVTPVSNTTIYVKNDGDLTEVYPSGSTSPCGLPYDQAIPLNALNFARIRDLADNDQSGTALYTCGPSGGLDGVKFAAVWGEDASTALTGNPSIDVGTLMQPRCLGQLIIANDDFEETPPNTPVIIGVSSNDVGFLCNVDETSIRTDGLLQPTNGFITINNDGTITYIPNTNFTGVDVFEYMICSIEYPGVCDMATVTVTITTCGASPTVNLINGKVYIQQLPDDGQYNGTETFAAGITVDLYGDPNGNGIIDPGEIIEQSEVSDLSGNYQFTTFDGYHAEDNFDPTAGFSGNDGSVPWSSNWVEQGDDLNFTTGDVRIMTDVAPGANGNAIRIDGPSNGISRSLAFVNATGNATLKLKYRRQALLDNGAALQVQVNGTTLYNINDGNGVGTDNFYHDLTIPVPPANYNANGTNTVRLLSTSGLTTAEYYWIDDVEFAYFNSSASYYIVKVNTTNTNGEFSPSILQQQTASFSSGGTCDNNNYLGVLPMQTDLEIMKSDDAISFGPGGQTVYLVEVTNNGPANVTNATVNDALPPNATSMTWTASGSNGATVTNSSGSGSIVNETVNLPVGGIVTYYITVNIACGTPDQLVNTATVTPPISVGEKDNSNNTATDTDVQNYWTGNTSSAWGEPSNWTIGVPSCNPPMNAVIPAGRPNYPIITTNGNFAAHLRIEDGGTLTINPGKDLTVCGCTEVNEPFGLIIRSNPSGNASFINQGIIQYDVDGFAKTELYITKPDTVVGHQCRGCWHYVSPPTSGATSSVYFGYYLKAWTEDGTPAPGTYNGWSPYITSGTYPLNVTEGYAVSRPESANPTPEFLGYLNTGPYTIPLTRTVDAGYGYNLVGNPYTSYLDMGSSEIEWNDVDQKVWYYSQLKGNYNLFIVNGVGNGTRYCPSMQGFFVHVSSTGTSGTLGLSPDARVATGDTTFYKDGEIEKEVLRIKVQKSDDSFYDEAIVNFRPDATKGFDRNLDGPKMYGTNEAPQLYTISDDGDYLTVNCLDYLDQNIVIPLHFSVATQGSGSYTLRFTGQESFEFGEPILLEDKQQGNLLQDVTIDPEYTFNYTQGADAARFLLHFKNPTFGINEQNRDNSIQIYSFERFLYVRFLKEIPSKGRLTVYNMLGMEVFSSDLEKTTLNKFDTGLSSGYYVVRVVTEKKIINTTVFIK